jgi:hypothetical protein
VVTFFLLTARRVRLKYRPTNMRGLVFPTLDPGALPDHCAIVLRFRARLDVTKGER